MRCASRAALVLCALATLAACGGSGSKSAAPPGTAAAKSDSSSWLPDIKLSGGKPFYIALVSATTGPYARQGDELRAGVGQAVDDLDANGGVLDRVMVMRPVDDRCDPKYAQAIARGIAAQHIQIVIGHLCPAATLAAADIYGEAGILLLAPTTTDDALTDDAAARGRIDIVRVAPRDDEQGALLAHHLRTAYPNAPVALVSDGTEYGKTIVDSTRRALVAAGVHPVLDETVVPASEAYASLVGRMKAAGVGAVIYGGASADGAHLLLEMRHQGLAAAFGGGSLLFAPQFWTVAQSAAEGTFMPWLPDPAKIMSGTLQPYAGNRGGYSSGLGMGIQGYTLYGYAAVQVFAQAATRANSIDPLAVAKAIRQGSYQTVIGRLTFDAKGDAQGLGFVLYAWHNGGYVSFND